MSDHFLHDFLRPKSIAIYGANNSFGTTMGTMLLLRIINSNYKGKIFPIHLKLGIVLGYKAYRAQQAYTNAKKQYKLMQKRANSYKKLAKYHQKATKYSRAYQAQDSRTFDSEAKVWESGVNVEPLYRPGLDFKQLKGKVIRGY